MSEQYAEQADAVVDNDTSALDAEPSLVLDEDRLGADPLEDGMDTADDYSRAVKLGGTQDAEDQDSLAHRLPQEEDDPAQHALDADPARPLGATPVDELDESVDEPDPEMDGTAENDAGAVELGVDSAAGANEPTGLPADDGIGAVASMTGEEGAEGAEQEALRIESEG